MRSPHAPKLHLPSRVAQICRFTSQPYVRDVRQRRTSLTFYDLLGDPAKLSVLISTLPSGPDVWLRRFNTDIRSIIDICEPVGRNQQQR
jgi:hypothetical protein